MENYNEAECNEKEYTVIKTAAVSLGRFKIVLDTVREAGKDFPYSYIEMKRSVGILAFTDGGIVLVRQYRHALGAYELEIPGGAVDNGEKPEQAAYRELLEETGYAAFNIHPLGKYYPSPGSSDEVTYLFYAKCRFEKTASREPLEYIRTVVMTEKELESEIRRGDFRHGMGLAAWLKFYMLKRGK